MRRSVLFITPYGIKEGQPSFERIRSFQSVYDKKEYSISNITQPRGIGDVIRLIFFIITNKKEIFISMPSFRCWWLFFIPFQKITLDIRDGWSIAMKSGYGGTSKPQKIKSFIASWIEIFAIKRSEKVITCTNGLQLYLENLSNSKILLITNGVSLEDVRLVNKIKASRGKLEIDHTRKLQNKNITAVCVGQFSEYGTEKVKSLLKRLSLRFCNESVQVQLIGSNYERNTWITDWLKSNAIVNIEIIFFERVNRVEMYQKLLEADLGLLVIRDPNYDFGTKVFDYILCELPVFNYFTQVNNFTSYFEGCFLDDAVEKKDVTIRELEIEKEFSFLDTSL